MTGDKVETAVAAAREFIAGAEALIAARAETVARWKYEGMCPKESGGLRRKSMDLTRALAEMRRP